MRRGQNVITDTVCCPKCKTCYKNTDLKQAAYMKCLWCGHMLIEYKKEKDDNVKG